MARTDPANSGMENNLPLIQASELAQYSFCQRAWWLGTVKKLPSVNQSRLDRGTARHAQHGQQVRAALYWQRVGLFLLGSGGFVLMLALLWLWWVG